jgi:hypothetical protein
MAKHGTGGHDDGRPIVSMRTMEIAIAAILLAFGATFLYSSYKLGFRRGADGPQSGFFPFYVSLFICIASAATLLQAILSKSAAGRESFVERGQLKQVLKVLIPAGLFVLGIQLIGIYVASAIYIALFMIVLISILAYFGAPVAHEDDPRRAVGARALQRNRGERGAA